jgi:sugar O-acyltransferase (sialic acid O-acetyltransferase NeuD family)
VILGGRGSGAIVAESVHALAAGGTNLRVVGFLNDVLPRGELVSGVPVIGPFASWRELPEETVFVAPLHKAKAMPGRVRIIEELEIPNHRWITIVDPRSAVASDASIGRGCFVGPFASVGPAARLGAHSVIRAGAHVSHDCTIGDFVFVGSNAVVCGYGVIGDGAYIAPSATVRDGLHIGRFAVIGLGAAVTKDVLEFAVAAGVPASPIGAALDD